MRRLLEFGINLADNGIGWGVMLLGMRCWYLLKDASRAEICDFLENEKLVRFRQKKGGIVC